MVYFSPKKMQLQPSSLFYEPDKDVRRVKVICSTNERRSYNNRSVFFIHPLFNGESEWPMKTDIVCRYDEEHHDAIPIPLPVDYDAESNTYTCYGLFCSASCVKAFLETNPIYSNALSIIWLKKIMCEVFGDHDDIVAAPPKDLHKKHGGELTTEQFRQFCRQKTNIISHTLPFFTCALAFELVKEYGNDQKQKEKSIEEEYKDVKKLRRNLTVKKNNAKSDKPSKTKKNNGDDESNKSQVNIENEEDNEEKKDDDDDDDDDNNKNNIHSNNSNNDYNYSDGDDDINVEKVLCNININNNENRQSNDNDPNKFLPNHFTMVSANVGNKWEIRGLKRSTNPTQIQSFNQNATPTKSMFTEYLDSKLMQNKSDENTKNETFSTKSPTDKQELKNTNEEVKPLKRRGRPKSTNIKPESPKHHSSHGSLVSFLKS